MARENQGLQISLILFVLLSILLAVTTFVFYRQWSETEERRVALETQANELEAANRSLTTNYDQLKDYVGVAQGESAQRITEIYEEDMARYAINLPPDQQNYRRVAEYSFNTLRDLNSRLAATQTSLEQLQQTHETREAVKQAQIDQHLAARQEAEADRDARLAEFRQTRQQMESLWEQGAAHLVQARDQAREQLAALGREITGVDRPEMAAMDELGRVREELVAARTDLGEIVPRYNTIRDRIQRLTDPSFEVADGEIRWLNQRNRTVWINLGRADGLLRLMTFSVYDHDAEDVGPASPKGSIEVVQIIGEHLAEARIVDDNLSNPIKMGDKIHTPVWNPGERRSFALAGLIDVTGDGRCDVDRVRALIEMNGGAVDAYMYADGRRVGELSPDTFWLVTGEPPTELSPEEFRTAWGEMIEEARSLRVPRADLSDLLTRMGWRPRATVARYGRAGGPVGERLEFPDGMQPVAPGTVSPLHREERRPPARD